MLYDNGWEKETYVLKELGLFLSVNVDNIKLVGKSKILKPMWKNLQKDIDPEDPTPLINQVYLGCTQREAKADRQAVRSKTELFKK